MVRPTNYAPRGIVRLVGTPGAGVVTGSSGTASPGTSGNPAGTTWKAPVRVATTANGALATAYENGDTVDGIVLATGDRILLKDQSAQLENGIYVVNASGAPTRAFDMDDNSEVVGAIVFVLAGSTNGGKTYRNTNTTAPIIGTDPITFAVLISGAAGTTLPWINVEDHGAVHDGVTDDTTAIQAAINAAEAAGGAVVFFPLGVYIIAGALQDTGRSNAQLLLPRRQAYSATEQITVRLLGELAPPAVPSVVGSMVLPDNGPVLKSTLASGTGAVIGAWGPSGSFDDFTNLRAVIENLTVRTVVNPTNSGVDLSRVAVTELRNVNIDAGNYDVASLSLQTTATSFGLKLPGNNNGASTDLDIVNVVGFYNGILVGEHTIGDNVAVWGARKGVTFPLGNHAIHFDRLGTYHCIVGLTFTGAAYFEIDQFNVEHADTGTWVTTADIDDASNLGKGKLIYHVVLANTGPDTTFTKTGGTGIAATRLGDNSAVSPLTTKGDLYGYSTVGARVPVGVDGTVLTAASSQALGVAWQTPAAGDADHLHVIGELRSGDGSTTAFEIDNEPEDGSVAAYVAGVRTAVTLSGAMLTTVTFGSAPASGTDNIVFDYVAVVS